jgi:hypothetical protein
MQQNGAQNTAFSINLFLNVLSKLHILQETPKYVVTVMQFEQKNKQI